MEKKYIVGVDFGHGETAAWVVPLKKKKTAEPLEQTTIESLEQTAKMESCGQSLMIRRSKKNESEKKIDSVVYIGRNGSFGANEGECPDSTLNNEFKGRICKLTDCSESNCKGCTIQKTCKKFAYRSFIRMVYKRICELNKDILVQEGKESNFYFQIACPTNWEEKDKKEYIDFFNDALSEFGVQIDYLMNESDAAYFCFNSEDTPSPDKVVLVIDYGSSTIDYTVVMGDKKISDDKWSSPNLGASEIEKTILSLYMNQNEDKFNSTCETVKEILLNNNLPYIADSIIPRLEYAVRKQKEQYYTESHAHFRAGLNFWGITGIDELQPYVFNVSCEIDEAIKKYKDAVHTSFKKLHEDIIAKTNGRPVNKIILSGGASIMPWVSEYVSAIFGQDVVIEEDGDPGYVVAKGVTYYAQKRIEALEQLIDDVNRNPFRDIYIKSFENASSETSISELNKFSETLNITNNGTANDIRTVFLNCLSSLNDNNKIFTDKTQVHLDREISNKLRYAIGKAIKDIFHIEVDTSDISAHVDAINSWWKQSNFLQGGAFFDKISSLAESSLGRLNSIGFNWNKFRSPHEQSKIIGSIKNGMVNYFRNDYHVSFDDKDLTYYIEQIKKTSIKEAIRIFNTKDVFKSTFIR